MPIDSIAVSGHKFLGCPMPCGITLTRKEHIAKMSQEIEYLNSVDTTIMVSSRSADAGASNHACEACASCMPKELSR